MSNKWVVLKLDSALARDGQVSEHDDERQADQAARDWCAGADGRTAIVGKRFKRYTASLAIRVDQEP